MAERVLLLAGSFGPERVPARRDPDDADWFLPLHLRDPRGARGRIAAQVERGADLVVAPTWLTHRRALLPLGETRRAGAWTTTAVQLAREALEIGLERRAEALTEVAGDDPRQGRPRPLLAASLPALDEQPEPASGRLLPADAATERDYREQAGWLADAEPDLILVEGQRTEASARVALAEAVATGLPVWAALTPTALALSGTEGWLAWVATAGVARTLWPPPLEERLPVADAPLPWGALGADADVVPSWLDAGAGAVALTDGATVAAIGRMRTAIDDHERASIAAEHGKRRHWRAHVDRAAAMAPGGAALWIGPGELEGPPCGFEWVHVERSQLPRLPEGRFRFAVDPVGTVDDALVRVLERGGLAVVRPGPVAGLRLVVLDDSAEPPLAIYRREGDA